MMMQTAAKRYLQSYITSTFHQRRQHRLPSTQAASTSINAGSVDSGTTELACESAATKHVNAKRRTATSHTGDCGKPLAWIQTGTGGARLGKDAAGQLVL